MRVVKPPAVGLLLPHWMRVVAAVSPLPSDLVQVRINHRRAAWVGDVPRIESRRRPRPASVFPFGFRRQAIAIRIPIATHIVIASSPIHGTANSVARRETLLFTPRVEPLDHVIPGEVRHRMRPAVVAVPPIATIGQIVSILHGPSPNLIPLLPRDFCCMNEEILANRNLVLHLATRPSEFARWTAHGESPGWDANEPVGRVDVR